MMVMISTIIITEEIAPIQTNTSLYSVHYPTTGRDKRGILKYLFSKLCF